MLRDQSGGASGSPKKIFSSVRFVLFGFDSVSEAQYRSELLDGGGIDVGQYDSSCTHVIVSGRAFDEPICVAARNDRKILVTELWIDDSLDFGMLADSTKVLYRPVRDLSGISGSKSLHICLTGYQRQERDDIMRMVSLMGAHFSKPLIANQATHLICYKFEGEKYELAKKVNIKLVNHRWLEDCLKMWEILPVDNYNKSGSELEMLEAEAMDSEEEAEDAGRKIREHSIGEPHSSRGEISGIPTSGTLAEDTRNFSLQNDVFAARSFGPSVSNRLIYTPHKEKSSDKATDIYDTNNKVLKVFSHPEDKTAEQFPDTTVYGKQTPVPDCTDLSMKYNGFPSNARNSFMGMTSCDEDMKLSPLRYSRKSCEKVVSPEEQFNDLCDPHKVKQEVNLKGDANNNSAESNKNAAKKFINSSLHVEKPIISLSKKRKLSVSRIGSKSIKSGHISRTSSLMKTPTSIDSAELDSLNQQQQELEDMLTHTETGLSISDMVRKADASPQFQKISDSSTYLRTPKSVQVSRTCSKEGPSTSMLPGECEYISALQYENDHGHTHSDNFEGIASEQPRGNQHGPVSKSSSLGYKRKSLKHGLSTPVTNVPGNSSSESDKKDELLHVHSKPVFDGSVCMRYEADSGVGIMCDIPSPEAVVLPDCPQNKETGPAEDISAGNVTSLCRSTEAGDGGDSNEASTRGNVLEASLKSINESEIAVNSHKFDGFTGKYKSDVYNKVTEEPEKSGKYEEVIPPALRDSKVKNSVGTEIPASCKQNKGNRGSIQRNHKVLGSRNAGSRSTERKKGRCEEKISCSSLKSSDFNKTAARFGNGTLELGSEDSHKEKVGKDDSPVEEKMEMNQCHQSEINSKVTQDEKCLVPENGNKLKNGCNFSVREGDCSHTKKKKYEPSLGAKFSSKDNISSLVKHNSSCAISEPICFILSGNHTQRKEFHIIISRLRGRICKDSHNWSYKATHFIVPNTIRRTEKFFAAAAAGRWILKPDYLTACSEAGKFLEEEPFECYGNGLTEDGAINLEAPRKWRTLKQRTGYGAFHGMRIVIYGECIAPSLDTLKRAVKAGDGAILATSPPYTRPIKSGVDFAVVSASVPHADAWVQEFLRHEIPCILSDYLVEYVCKPGYSLEGHVLYKTHAWVEKAFANLQCRISEEEMVSDEGPDGDGSDDLICSVCGSRERGEVMLICGDDADTLGCGLASHIDCCDPPLAAVPEDDWFCSECCKRSGRKNLLKSSKVKLKKVK